MALVDKDGVHMRTYINRSPRLGDPVQVTRDELEQVINDLYQEGLAYEPDTHRITLVEGVDGNLYDASQGEYAGELVGELVVS